MKKKRNIIFIILFLIIAGGVYYYFTAQDENTSLTVLDRQWIESNKNNLIDLSIINEVSIINYSGTGIVFDFLNSLEEDTGLTFNKNSFDYGDTTTADYTITVVNEATDNEIFLYQDNYALITKNNNSYEIEEIKNFKIGVLSTKMEDANKYLTGSTNVSFVGYDTYEELLEAYDNLDVDASILPKLPYLDIIIESDDYNISYNITEMTEDYVISLGDETRLNSILTKYYNNWSSKNLTDSFNNYLSYSYFNFADTTEKEEVDFRSKRYTYGFVDTFPYDTTLMGSLLGINSSFIKSFSLISGVEINFQKYNNIEELTNAFNSNEIDFYFNNAYTVDYNMDVYNTVSFVDEDITVLSNNNNNITVNSIYSITNEKVLTIKNSKVDEYLTKLNIETKQYDDLETLIKKIDNNSVIVVDKEIYNYYKTTEFADMKVDYEFSLDSTYSYTLRDISDNEVFNEFLDFYLSFINHEEIINDSYVELYNIGNKPFILRMIIITLSSIAAFIVIFMAIKLIKPKKKEVKLNKQDKLKYIDMLTSLKNRNYLNDNIEKWDESQIYPQTIMIVDLNNVAYINDNYGHAEGDEVICQASSILIQNQLPNSEIIRTNGNEFLIYLVEYNEKQVINYTKTLNKQFKNLKHGFGAAIGSSIITDGIKTIDDAINEATLDMRNNKEEINN